MKHYRFIEAAEVLEAAPLAFYMPSYRMPTSALLLLGHPEEIVEVNGYHEHEWSGCISGTLYQHITGEELGRGMGVTAFNATREWLGITEAECFRLVCDPGPLVTRAQATERLRDIASCGKVYEWRP